ncbi:MAG: hypothetical protein LBO74_07865 [Candidatus Symbiothrix sp.]|nr:hypothetical protein [Candidatus Symbiothrix sp.]
MAEYVNSVTEYDDVKRAMAYHLKEGIAKGERRGRKKGRREGICEIARNLLKMQMQVDDIAKATNLTPEEILKIK